MDKKERFIEKVIKKHGNSIDTSKVEYIDSKTKVCLICHKKNENGIEHGEYWQSPAACVRGNCCPKCANEKRGKHTMTTEKLIEEYNKIHNDEYDYSNVKYKTANDKVCIICSKHGEFWQLPFAHLQGQGCPKCKGRSWNTDVFIAEAKKKHNNEYTYKKTSFTKMKEKVCITCSKHGDFWQTPQKHLQGQGCPICGREKVTSTIEDNTLNFVKCGNIIHNGKYKYIDSDYIDSITKVRIICPIHGEFWQRPNNHLQGCGCPKCANNNSIAEDEIIEFLQPLECQKHNRTILNGKEIDIYIPSLKIGIEYNGLRWHSEQFDKDKEYHLKKLEECEKQGVRLIQIFEDEWLNKKEICKSRILNIIGKTNKVIFARKCIIKEVDSKTSREFLDDNHIQGNCGSKIRLGLFYNDELVSLMTFGKLRKNLGNNSKDGCYELLRFCNKLNTSVVGGASKLFKHFIEANNVYSIISYSDRRWNSGNLYKTLGFALSHKSQPSYFYVVKGVRKNRFSYRKDILIKEGYDPNKTEHQIMLDRGIYRIYDCGCLVYEYKKSEK